MKPAIRLPALRPAPARLLVPGHAGLGPVLAFLCGPTVLLRAAPAHANNATHPAIYMVGSLFTLVYIFVSAYMLALGARWVLSRIRRGAATSKPPINPKRVAVRSTVVAVIPLAALVGLSIRAEIRRPLKWKTAEAKSNLGAISSTNKAHLAERGVYVGGQPPTPIPDRRHHPEKAAWDSSTRFSILGFYPEGNVYYSYAIEGPAWPSSEQGFTARAEGDLDDDGELEVFTITAASYDVTRSGDTSVW